MIANAEYARLLQQYLNLSLPPVAIRVTDQVPENVRPYQGQAPAGCSFWEEAAQKTFSTTAADHESCSIGIYTHNLAGAPANYQSELGDVLKVMAGMQYVRAEDIAAIPVLQKSSKHVIYSPLADCEGVADVVVLFADGRQGLLIAEMVQQVEIDLPPAMGRPACAMIPQAINTGRAALSLGCCGARAYLNAFTDSISLWALPGARLAQYSQRLEALAKANDLLGKFHQLRRADITAGKRPTYQESLERLSE